MADSPNYTRSHGGEHRRLAIQSQVWGAVTRRALERVSLPRGGQILDVGCGACDVMQLLGEQVGNTGRVTVMNSDEQLIDKVHAQMDGECRQLYRFITGSVTDDACDPGGPFDLVFARLLLLHLPDPTAALRKLWQWVRPGGVLLIMDYDLTGMRSVPQHPTIERVLRLINAAFRRAQCDIEIGSRMPALFGDAGIGSPDECEVHSVILPGARSTNMLREMLGSLSPIMLANQIADEAALARIDQELSGVGFDAHFLRWPDLTATWKRERAETGG